MIPTTRLRGRRVRAERATKAAATPAPKRKARTSHDVLPEMSPPAAAMDHVMPLAAAGESPPAFTSPDLAPFASQLAVITYTDRKSVV